MMFPSSPLSLHSPNLMLLPSSLTCLPTPLTQVHLSLSLFFFFGFSLPYPLFGLWENGGKSIITKCWFFFPVIFWEPTGGFMQMFVLVSWVMGFLFFFFVKLWYLSVIWFSLGVRPSRFVWLLGKCRDRDRNFHFETWFFHCLGPRNTEGSNWLRLMRVNLGWLTWLFHEIQSNMNRGLEFFFFISSANGGLMYFCFGIAMEDWWVFEYSRFFYFFQCLDYWPLF